MFEEEKACSVCRKKYSVARKKRTEPCWSCHRVICVKCSAKVEGRELGWVAPHICCINCETSLLKSAQRHAVNTGGSASVTNHYSDTPASLDVLPPPPPRPVKRNESQLIVEAKAVEPSTLLPPPVNRPRAPSNASSNNRKDEILPPPPPLPGINSRSSGGAGRDRNSGLDAATGLPPPPPAFISPRSGGTAEPPDFPPPPATIVSPRRSTGASVGAAPPSLEMPSALKITQTEDVRRLSRVILKTLAENVAPAPLPPPPQVASVDASNEAYETDEEEMDSSDDVTPMKRRQHTNPATTTTSSAAATKSSGAASSDSGAVAPKPVLSTVIASELQELSTQTRQGTLRKAKADAASYAEADSMFDLSSLDAIEAEARLDVPPDFYEDPIAGIAEALANIASTGDEPEQTRIDMMEVVQEVKRENAANPRAITMLESVEDKLRSGSPELGHFKLNQTVSVKHAANGHYYSGKVCAVLPYKSYRVQLSDDGSVLNTVESDMLELIAGDAVYAKHRDDNLWYQGTIESVTPQALYDVLFSDGTRQADCVPVTEVVRDGHDATQGVAAAAAESETAEAAGELRRAEAAARAAEEAKAAEEAQEAARKAKAAADAAAVAAKQKRDAEIAAAAERKKKEEEEASRKKQEAAAAAAAAAIKKRQQEDEARLRREETERAEAAARKRREDEAKMKKLEAEAAAKRKRLEEEARLRKEEAEQAEAEVRALKQEEEAARQQVLELERKRREAEQHQQTAAASARPPPVKAGAMVKAKAAPAVKAVPVKAAATSAPAPAPAPAADSGSPRTQLARNVTADVEWLLEAIRKYQTKARACVVDSLTDRRTLLVCGQVMKHLKTLYSSAEAPPPFALKIPDASRVDSALFEKLLASLDQASQFMIEKLSLVKEVLKNPRVEINKVGALGTKVRQLVDWFSSVESLE